MLNYGHLSSDDHFGRSFAYELKNNTNLVCDTDADTK